MPYGPKPRPIADRLWEKVDKSAGPDSCWPYMGGRLPKGYGVIGGGRGRGKTGYAHRVAYELTFGPIPEGLQVCHHCDNPPCCNPAHFFVGTHNDNHGDKIAKGRARGRNSGTTHCPRGHAYDAKNTYVTPSGARACRTCCRAKSREDRRLLRLRDRDGVNARARDWLRRNPDKYERYKLHQRMMRKARHFIGSGQYEGR